MFGATGFVGRLVAEHLAAYAPGGTRLVDVRRDLGPPAADWPLVVADSANRAALQRMAERARVVATTVGPYADEGLLLVEACAAAGSDYADLTGELLFAHASIDRAHDEAVRSGTRIVHACGFDSVPSDLAVHLLHHRARADGAGELEGTTLELTRARGGVGGGTVASGLGQLAAVRRDPAVRLLLADPYALSPDRSAEPDLGDEADVRHPEHLVDPDVWAAPFVMARVQHRVVRRSNALLGHAYGRRFRYRADRLLPPRRAHHDLDRRPVRRAVPRPGPGRAAGRGRGAHPGDRHG